MKLLINKNRDFPSSPNGPSPSPAAPKSSGGLRWVGAGGRLAISLERHRGVAHGCFGGRGHVVDSAQMGGCGLSCVCVCVVVGLHNSNICSYRLRILNPLSILVKAARSWVNTNHHRFTPFKKTNIHQIAKVEKYSRFALKSAPHQSFNMSLGSWVSLHHPTRSFQESPRAYGPEHWNFLQLSRQEPGPPAEKLHRAAPASEPGCCAQAPSLAPEKVEQQGRVSQMKLGMIDGGEIQRLGGKCWETCFCEEGV